MSFDVHFSKPVGVGRGFERINVIWSIWLLALVGILGSAMPVITSASPVAEARFAFNYDVGIQTVGAYDEHAQSAFTYDSAAVLILKECWSGRCGSHGLFAVFVEFLAAEGTALREGSFSIAGWSGYPCERAKTNGAVQPFGRCGV